MNTKERIIERVNSISDPQLLDKLLQVIELEHEIEQLHVLTSDEKLAIDEGIKDAESGNLHTTTEASQLVKEWLKK
mgnify:CR=1 FL=1